MTQPAYFSIDVQGDILASQAGVGLAMTNERTPTPSLPPAPVVCSVGLRW